MNILWQVFYKVSAFVNSPEFLRSFFDNRFYLILLVIILMRFKYATYSSMWMSALVNIPGTFLHELMHYLVGSLLISALVIFPALSAMRVYKNFCAVTICAAVLSVCCAALGILISILAGTPVGSTIVAVDIFAFLIFSGISRLGGIRT